MIVRCDIVDKKIRKVRFLPVLINPKAQPQVVRREDKNFAMMLDYMKEINGIAKLDTNSSSRERK